MSASAAPGEMRSAPGLTGGTDSRGRSSSPPRSPPRDRIAARPPRRRRGSGNRGSSSMGPYSSGAGGKRRSGPPSISDCSRSSSSKPGSGRDEDRAPGEGPAGRARDVVPGLRRGRLRVLPRRSPRALPPARVSRARLRGAMTASLFRLVLGGGRRLGKLCSLGAAGREVRIIKRFRWPSWSPAWLFGLDLAEFALAVAFPLEIPPPVRVLDQDPSPARLSRPRGTTRLQAGCARAPPGGEPAVRTRSVREEGPPAGRRRLAHSPIPRRTGGAFRIDHGAHERTCPGAHDLGPNAHDLGPALTVSVSVLGAWWSRKRGGKRLVGRFGS